MIRRSIDSRRVRSRKKSLRKTRTLRAELLEPRAMMSVSGSVWTLGAVPLAGVQSVASQTAVLGDNADTTVQNGASTYKNFGKTSTLSVAKNALYGSESQAVLRFDMSTITDTVSSAILTLTRLQSSSTNQNTTLRIRLASDAADNWVEGTGGYSFRRVGAMTWTNRVQGTGLSVTIAASQWSASGTFSVDVTSLLNQTFNANHVATFVLDIVAASRSNSSITLASREYAIAGYRPSLTVTSLTDTNQAPSLATSAAAAANPVSGTSSVLSVLGADDGGESNLTYTWTTASLPSGATAPTFSANGTNAAKNTSVSFSQAGTYTFTARISDTAGLSLTSSVTVVVSQTFTSIVVTPNNESLLLGAQQQFAAAALDQFGNALVASPALTWSASSGSITSGGLFTAPTTAGNVTVTAASGSIHGTASVAVSASTFLGLKDSALASLTQSLYVDGSISRLDMIQILRSVGLDDSLVDAIEIADLRTILGNASTLNTPGYVQVLAADVVNGNAANAYFQGTALGNLVAGSSAVELNCLVDKWFLGADHPGDAGLNYVSACGTLFVNGPSHLDMHQGQLGDCYFIAALGSIADSSASAIQNMFIDNGDNTWTVRFYVNGTADYVTVDRMLPVNSSGRLIYANYGYLATSASNELWIALAEKAYAQWNETGKEGRDGRNLYESIEGGWMADVYAQTLGTSASSYSTSNYWNYSVLANAMNNNLAVTIGTKTSSYSSGTLSYGLYGNHAYTIVGYNRSTGKYTLYNPWGCCQPTQSLTWLQLRTVCDFFSVANPAGSTAISQTRTPWAGAQPSPAWGGDQSFAERRESFAVPNALAVDLVLQHVS